MQYHDLAAVVVQKDDAVAILDSESGAGEPMPAGREPLLQL